MIGRCHEWRFGACKNLVGRAVNALSAAGGSIYMCRRIPFVRKGGKVKFSSPGVPDREAEALCTG